MDEGILITIIAICVVVLVSTVLLVNNLLKKGVLSLVFPAAEGRTGLLLRIFYGMGAGANGTLEAG